MRKFWNNRNLYNLIMVYLQRVNKCLTLRIKGVQFVVHLPHLKKVANHFLKEEGKEERQNFITGNLTESSVRKAYKKKRH